MGRWAPGDAPERERHDDDGGKAEKAFSGSTIDVTTLSPEYIVLLSRRLPEVQCTRERFGDQVRHN